MNALLESALQYAARGWHVFPCESRGKKPLIKTGYKAASTDPRQIEEWWRQWPDANIGIATGPSDLAVLDCDGPEGFAQLEMLAAAHDSLPRTLTARTARGAHIYYAGTCKSTQIKGEKLDTRGSTGYVVAPPSVHETGAVYQWVEQAPLSGLPAWIADWAVSRKGGPAPQRALLPARSHPQQEQRGTRRSLAERAIAAQSEVPYSESEAKRLRSALSAIDAAIDGATWFAFGAALHDLKWHVNGTDQGFEIWDEWSSTSQGEGPGNGEYKGRGDLAKRWASFDREYNGIRTTVASIYKQAMNAGWQYDNVNGHSSLGQTTPPFFQQAAFQAPIIWPDRDQYGKPKVTCRNARTAIRHMGITCEHDRFHDKLIIGGEPIAQWAGELTDHATHMLRVTIAARYNLDPGTTHTFDAAVQECLQDSFDPIADYLDGLAWDGTPRLRTWLTAYMGAEATALNCAIGGLMLIAAVRRVRQPGCKFDQIAVLISDEGKNKSSAIEILAGPENFSDQTILTLDDKGQQEAITGVWLYEIADLAGMSKADTEKVKAFASRRVDRARPAYARARVDKPRRCVFFATTNHSTFLKAQTGNRRFWPVEVGRIDLAALARDRDQLWAEAAMIEARGVSLFLPEPLWAEATRAQELRLDVDPWDDILSRVDKDKITTRDLLDTFLRINPKDMTDYHVKRLGHVMRRLGWRGPTTLWIDNKAVKGYKRGDAGMDQ